MKPGKSGRSADGVSLRSWNFPLFLTTPPTPIRCLVVRQKQPPPDARGKFPRAHQGAERQTNALEKPQKGHKKKRESPVETPVLFLSQRSGFALASPVNIRDPFIGTGSIGIHNAPAERLFGKEFSFQAVSGIFKGEGFLAF